MMLRILHVPDCPNVGLLRARLADLGVEIEVTEQVIENVEAADAAGMTGSPTLLVDGLDPFVEPGQAPSISCRLYRDETGNLTGAPSEVQLRAALAASARPAGVVAAATVTAKDCCGPVENTAAAAEGLRTWRARTAPADPAARAVHQAILRAFANSGSPPTEAVLGPLAAAHGATPGSVLTRLHDADVIRLDLDGAIAVAYPFSAVPTRHRVRLGSGVEISAMCAIDALGIPAMLHTDAIIISADPVTDQPVTVTVHTGQYRWNPATAVVFYSHAAGTGPSADCCCNDLNAFTDPTTAGAWMQAHPTVAGELLDAAAAEHLGRHIFGDLLNPAADHPDDITPRVRVGSNSEGHTR